MKVNTLTIDSTESFTDLCELGVIHPTDKSPYNKDNNLHKHAYTGIYDLLFSHIRYNNIIMGEFGIYNNESMKCWRNYFPNAILYGYEWNDAYLRKANNDNLHNTFYIKMNVEDTSSISKGLITTFDILIDDSTHSFTDQMNIINTAYKHLKPGGFLIIEDIFLSEKQDRYIKEMINVNKYFSSATFIYANHSLKHSPGWENDKLLVLVRNNIPI